MMEGGGMGHPFSRLDQGGQAPKIVWSEASLPRVLGLFRAYIKQLVLIIILAATVSIISLGPPLILMDMIDTAIPTKDMQRFGFLIVLLVVLPVSSGLLGVFQNHSNNKVAEGVMRDLRDQLYSNLQKQSVSFFTSSRSGEIVQRLIGDVQTVQEVLSKLVVSGITQTVVVFSTIGVLLYLDWALALVSLTILPLFIIPVRLVSRKRKRLRAEVQEARSDLSAQINEMFGVSGALLTKLFNQEVTQHQRFSEVNERVMNLELRLQFIGRWFLMLVAILGPLGTALVYFYGGWNVMLGRMSIGEIVAFAACLTRLYQPVSQLMNLHVEVATALAVFKRIFNYLDLRPDVIEVEQPLELPSRVNGNLLFTDVSFAYHEGQPVLHNITFEAMAGKLVALVGPSGAGKSSLLGLVPRLYDPQSGDITIDGISIKDVSLRSLRKTMATVTQETFLWHATIRENLLFSRPDATDEQVEHACRKAHIYDFITKLPQGFETIVGERGHRLSGGERQRLAIARAILAEPNILLLDEATAHLDTESERFVQEALAGLMTKCTTIVIAHRLSTVLSADLILVLDEGRIVERGTHAQLMTHNGLYAQLYRTPTKTNLQ